MQEAVKSDELQIGNYVLNRKNQIVEITVDDLKLLSIWEANPYTKNPPFRPVKLIDEILLRFGFEKDVDDLYLDIDTVFFVSYIDDEFVHLKSNNLEKIISMQHAHTLQNLYSLLTGEKLKFIV